MRRVERAAEFTFAFGLFWLTIGPPIALAPLVREWSWAALARGLVASVGVPLAICSVSLAVSWLAVWRDRHA